MTILLPTNNIGRGFMCCSLARCSVRVLNKALHIWCSSKKFHFTPLGRAVQKRIKSLTHVREGMREVYHSVALRRVSNTREQRKVWILTLLPTAQSASAARLERQSTNITFSSHPLPGLQFQFCRGLSVTWRGCEHSESLTAYYTEMMKKTSASASQLIEVFSIPRPHCSN